jgi:hypothetical protein
MARDGQIGHRGWLKAIADALQMEGVNRFPAVLNRDQVQVVVNMDAGWADYSIWETQTVAAIGIGGIALVTWPIVGNVSGSAIMDPYRQIENAGHEFVIMGMRISIVYTAGGAVTDDGDVIQIDFVRQGVPSSNVIYESRIRCGTIENGGIPDYGFNFPINVDQPYMTATATPRPAAVSSRQIWVPAGSTLQALISKTDGTNFAANTDLKVWAWGVKTKKGIKPPLL